MAGLEVEQTDCIGDCLTGIITGRIDSITKHPDADKLVITSIFDNEIDTEFMRRNSKCN